MDSELQPETIIVTSGLSGTLNPFCAGLTGVTPVIVTPS